MEGHTGWFHGTLIHRRGLLSAPCPRMWGRERPKHPRDRHGRELSRRTLVAGWFCVWYYETGTYAGFLSEESSVVRTQIQLTESQAKSLRKLACRSGISVAELVRRGVDQVLASGPSIEADQKKRQAMAASGRFRSGRRDVSVRHDHYLAKDSHT